MTTLHLYELAERYRSLLVLADSDDIPPDVIRDTLDALEGDLQDKAIACAQVILNLESTAESIKAAAEAMWERATRIKKRADSLRAYTLLHLIATGTARVECEFFTVLVQKNPPSVVVDDQSMLPAKFMVQPPPQADKSAIGRAIKAGEDVSGAHLEQGQSLRIRV